MLRAVESPRDTYSTADAAKVLKVDQRTVRKLLDRGELEGEREDGGRRRPYQASVHGLLEKRRTDAPEKGPQDGQNSPESVRELRSVVQDLSYRLGRSEARVELTEKAESTMADERRRLLEDLEREREERRQERARADRLEEELREARRPWWKRIFGG